MGKLIDITGAKFGRLLAMNRNGVSPVGVVMWECRCECGNTTTVPGVSLRNGHTKSCGCLSREMSTERFTTHGMYKDPEYSVWAAMVQRCGNPNDKAYKNYGSRGITVCGQWSSFDGFFKGMGKRPSAYHTIERIDNDKGYSADNCKWATRTEQQRNQRLRKNNKTGVTGVFLMRSGKYLVSIRSNYKQFYIGCFPTLREAAEARKQAEIKRWGLDPDHFGFEGQQDWGS